MFVGLWKSSTITTCSISVSLTGATLTTESGFAVIIVSSQSLVVLVVENLFLVFVKMMSLIKDLIVD